MRVSIPGYAVLHICHCEPIPAIFRSRFLGSSAGMGVAISVSNYFRLLRLSPVRHIGRQIIQTGERLAMTIRRIGVPANPTTANPLWLAETSPL